MGILIPLLALGGLVVVVASAKSAEPNGGGGEGDEGPLPQGPGRTPLPQGAPVPPKPGKLATWTRVLVGKGATRPVAGDLNTTFAQKLYRVPDGRTMQLSITAVLTVRYKLQDDAGLIENAPRGCLSIAATAKVRTVDGVSMFEQNPDVTRKRGALGCKNAVPQPDLWHIDVEIRDGWVSLVLLGPREDNNAASEWLYTAALAGTLKVMPTDAQGWGEVDQQGGPHRDG